MNLTVFTSKHNAATRALNFVLIAFLVLTSSASYLRSAFAASIALACCKQHTKTADAVHRVHVLADTVLRGGDLVAHALFDELRDLRQASASASGVAGV